MVRDGETLVTGFVGSHGTTHLRTSAAWRPAGAVARAAEGIGGRVLR